MGWTIARGVFSRPEPNQRSTKLRHSLVNMVMHIGPEYTRFVRNSTLSIPARR